MGFFGYGEEWYHFQQQLMVSKMIFSYLRYHIAQNYCGWRIAMNYLYLIQFNNSELN